MSVEKLDFDFSICRDLYENRVASDNDYKEAVKYFHDRVFYTRSGLVYYYEDGELKCDGKAEFETNQINGLLDNKLIKTIKSKIKPFKLVLEQNNPSVIDIENRKINSLAQMKINKIDPKTKVSENGKNYVKHFEKYVNEVLTGGNKQLFDIIMKFCAKTIRREKATIAVILVGSQEGTGKTTLAKILESILGVENVWYPSDETLMRFNFGAYGKALLCFEETEGVKGKVFSILKNMTTNDRYHFEKKNKDAQDLQNISNVFISSNIPVQFSGRRSLNITPTGAWFRKKDLWKQLYNFTDENKKALYDYLMSIDVNNWDEQEDVYQYNESQGGNLKEIERMNNTWKFLKDVYAFKKDTRIKIKPKELYEEYKIFTGTKAFQYSTFREKVKEIGINEHKISVNYYIINCPELYKAFKNRNLIHDEEEENNNEEIEEIDDEKTFLRNENAELKKQLEEMKKQISKLTKKQEEKPKEKQKDIFDEMINEEFIENENADINVQKEPIEQKFITVKCMKKKL